MLRCIILLVVVTLTQGNGECKAGDPQCSRKPSASPPLPQNQQQQQKKKKKKKKEIDKEEVEGERQQQYRRDIKNRVEAITVKIDDDDIDRLKRVLEVNFDREW